MKIAEIIHHTAEAYDVTPEQILAHRGGRRVEMARRCAMYLARKQAGNSLPKIGREFDRHHTTVMESVKGFPEWARRNGYARQVLKSVAAVARAQNAVAPR